MAAIVALDRGNAGDIAAMLETLAAEIRAGDHGEILSGAGVFYTSDDSLVVWLASPDGVAMAMPSIRPVYLRWGPPGLRPIG